MKKYHLLLFLCFLTTYTTIGQIKLPKNKAIINQSLEKHKTELIKISDAIWAKPKLLLKNMNRRNYWLIMLKRMDLVSSVAWRVCQLPLWLHMAQEAL